LLKILLAEDREIRADLREQFADHSSDAAEEVRPEPILQPGGGRAFGHDPGRKSLRVHRLEVWIPDQVDLFGGEFGDVGLPGARVRTEILRRRELRRVDEYRNDDFLRPALREPHQ
jgi:hypothetical protein